MYIQPVRTKKDYNNALKRIEKLWGAPLGTPHGDELDVLANDGNFFWEHFSKNNVAVRLRSP